MIQFIEYLNAFEMTFFKIIGTLVNLKVSGSSAIPSMLRIWMWNLIESLNLKNVKSCFHQQCYAARGNKFKLKLKIVVIFLVEPSMGKLWKENTWWNFTCGFSTLKVQSSIMRKLNKQALALISFLRLKINNLSELFLDLP